MPLPAVTRLAFSLQPSACAFLPELDSHGSSVGLKTAHKLLRTHRSLEAAAAHALPSSGDAPSQRSARLAEYLFHANRVRDVFRSQLVYDPSTQLIVPLTPLAATTARAAGATATAEHIGLLFEHPALVRALCIDASVDPITLEEVVGFGVGLPRPAPLPPPAPLTTAETDSAILGQQHSTADLPRAGSKVSLAAPDASRLALGVACLVHVFIILLRPFSSQSALVS